MVQREVDTHSIVLLNSRGYSSYDISVKTGIYYLRVKQELEKLNLHDNERMSSFEYYSKFTIEIEYLFKLGKSKKDISKILNIPNNIVCDIIRHYSILKSDKGFKFCGLCKKHKKTEKFGKDKSTNDGFRSCCKSCRNSKEVYNKEYQDVYRKKNKEKISLTNKIYRKKNKDKIKEYKKTQKAKEIKRKSDSNYYFNKIRKNPNLLIAARIRSQISGSIRMKKSSIFDLLGYKPSDLVNHLESNFLEGMNWDNYGRGGWHIDHIIPLAYFDKSKADWYVEAFSLSNLQPLFESENCSKGSLYNGIRYKNKKSTKK